MTAHESMPGWLVDHLVEQGVMTTAGVTRRAQGRKCQRCRALVLTGLDDETCARTAICDPTPLTALGEVVALLAGCRTWELTQRGDRHVLEARPASIVKSHPAGGADRYSPWRTYDVLPEHRCRDISLEQFATASRFETKADYASLPDNPPF